MKKKAEIKKLQYELGRYQKKVGDQALMISNMREKVRGAEQVQIAVDAILAAVAEKYGEDARDPDDPDKILGKRLVLPNYNALELVARYEVRARRDETTQEYIIGVVEKQK